MHKDATLIEDKELSLLHFARGTWEEAPSEVRASGNLFMY